MAHHDPNRPTVAKVLPLVRELYDGDRECSRGSGCVGGHLHIVLDDGNVDDSHVDFCIEEARLAGCAPCGELAVKLRAMSQTQRRRVYREKGRACGTSQ